MDNWDSLYHNDLFTMKSDLVGILEKYKLPRSGDRLRVAIDGGKMARQKAGVNVDINSYSFDMDNRRATSDDSIDARMFIGIPYRLGQIGFHGCDCMGLACMFYACNGWWLPKKKDGWEGTKKCFTYIRRWYKRIEKKDLQHGDLILHGNHVDIFLGWSPSNKNDYVLLNQSINSGEGCTTSQIITLGDWEYMESFNQQAEYFHRDESKDTTNYILSDSDMEVIKLNLIKNPYWGQDPFYFMLWRGYSVKNANDIAVECEKKLLMIDDRINGVIETARNRARREVYEAEKSLITKYNELAEKYGLEKL